MPPGLVALHTNPLFHSRKGTLNQYDELTMSRFFIDKNPGVFKDILEFSGFDDVISFKKYGIGKYHFGKTTGVDTLKDKNLTICGTPNQPEWLYKLFAATIGWLGWQNLLDENKTTAMRYRPVKHNGKLFWFMTFDDEFLRHVQRWFIESELEQSSGRSRLSRTEATVNVFSHFPLLQANQKKLPEHIINKYKKNKEKYNV